MNRLLSVANAIQPLANEAWLALSAICSTRQLKKGQILQAIGQTCKTIYFIEEGSARIFYYKEETDITEYFAFENNFIARAESLFTGRPSRKGIQILEDSTIISIDATELNKLYNRFTEIERLFRKITEAAYVETINRLESLQFHTAEERYKELVERQPGIIKRIPLKYIASYLGITPVSLSRIRSTLLN